MSLFTTMVESTCTVSRPQIGRDAAGGTTQPSFTTIVTNEPCSVQPASARAQELYAQRNTFVSTTIFFTRNIGAQVNDKVLVTDRDGSVHKFNVEGFSRKLFGRFQSPYSVDCQEISQVGNTP